MCSYSSCAKLFQKCDVLTVFSIGIKELYTALFLIDSESTRKFNILRLVALSIPHYVIKKGRSHGARHGKTEEQKKSTTQLGMPGRDAARKLTLKVDISQVFTIAFSEIQFLVNHNSQSDGHNKSAKSWLNLLKKTMHIVSLKRKREDGKDNGVSPWTNQAKMGLWNFDPIFELLSLSKIVYTTSKANKLKSLSIQTNTLNGITLQAHRGGTSLNGIGNELKSFFSLMRILFVTVGFVYSR